MSTVVFNPTNETFDAQYVGEAVHIKPGIKLKLEDPRAKHVLNELGPRGLCRLEYGDDEKKIAKDGIARNLVFKKKQVMNYNQMNEARRQQNQAYMEVPDHIIEYAKELGIGLIEPYNIKDKEREELSVLRTEGNEQRKQIKNLTSMVERLLQAQEAGEKIPANETEGEKEVADNRLKYIRLSKANLKGWVKNNKEMIAAWPETNQSEVRVKYADTYGEELKL